MHRGLNAICVAAALVSGAMASAGSDHGSNTMAGAHPQDSKPSPSVCDSGVLQSPIALKTCTSQIEGESFNIPQERPELKIGYGASQMDLEKVCVADGCVLQLSPKSGAAGVNVLEVPGGHHARHYKLENCVLRIPAEHTVNGHIYPLEVQCLHYLEYTHHRKYGMVSTLYQTGRDADNQEVSSPWIASFITSLPSVKNKTVGNAYFRPTGTAGLSRYYSYSGSRTTGNCDENVDWYVMYDPTGISEAQLVTLQANMTDHPKKWLPARHTQELFGREVEGCPVHHEESNAVMAGLSALSLAVVLVFA